MKRKIPTDLLLVFFKCRGSIDNQIIRIYYFLLQNIHSCPCSLTPKHGKRPIKLIFTKTNQKPLHTQDQSKPGRDVCPVRQVFTYVNTVFFFFFFKADLMRKILYRIILQIVENTDMARDVLKEIFKKKKKKDMLQTYPLFNPSGILSQE